MQKYILSSISSFKTTISEESQILYTFEVTKILISELYQTILAVMLLVLGKIADPIRWPINLIFHIQISQFMCYTPN